ncbi:sulfatase-like hydrolase/transferase [Stratiformator vulcanicus]|uniref:sulfatase-like hydrolase/transferase n=1 Tax=Stratiformator vulcanicus TaxID=2527980 RepID=UPI0011A0C8D4|nr:sulfatase-like hydrolase/transferase [Stratiformator vulcanicus]
MTVASGAGIAFGDRPNIVLIMADDLGADAIGCYGGEGGETPVLDQLAADGIRFTQCYSQPLCTPTRVQIMTGKYNFRNYTDFGYLNPDETTFADVLKEAGYRTGVFGKWQLSGSGREYPAHADPSDWGFDEYCLWQLNFRPGHGNKGSRYWDPKLEDRAGIIETSADDFGPDIFVERLCGFISQESAKPFFAYFPMAITHDPFVPTPEQTSAPTADHTSSNPKYFPDMVAYTDTMVGRIVKQLDDLGLRENTILIFTTDNGTSSRVVMSTVEGTVRGAKGQMNREGMWVPLIVNWPGHVEAGQVTDRLVDFTDVLPTLMAVAKIDAAPDQTLDGLPFLASQGDLPKIEREWIYSWYDPKHSKNVGRYKGVMAADRTHQLFLKGKWLRRWDGEPFADGDREAARKKLQPVLDRYAAQGGVMSE